MLSYISMFSNSATPANFFMLISTLLGIRHHLKPGMESVGINKIICISLATVRSPGLGWYSNMKEFAPSEKANSFWCSKFFPITGMKWRIPMSAYFIPFHSILCFKPCRDPQLSSTKIFRNHSSN